MRRLAAALAALAAALTLTAAPATATTDTWWPKTNCDSVGESAQLCLDVYSHRLNSGGLSLEHVYLRLQGGFWEANAFNCDYVEAWNDNAVVKWKRTGNACDIDKSPGYTLFHPDINMPDSANIAARVCGYPHLDKEVDPGRVCVTVHIP